MPAQDGCFTRNRGTHPPAVLPEMPGQRPASAPAANPYTFSACPESATPPRCQGTRPPRATIFPPLNFCNPVCQEPGPEAMGPSPGELPVRVLCHKPAGAPPTLSQEDVYLIPLFCRHTRHTLPLGLCTGYCHCLEKSSPDAQRPSPLFGAFLKHASSAQPPWVTQPHARLLPSAASRSPSQTRLRSTACAACSLPTGVLWTLRKSLLRGKVMGSQRWVQESRERPLCSALSPRGAECGLTCPLPYLSPSSPKVTLQAAPRPGWATAPGRQQGGQPARLPRRRRSLTNLSFLTDSEKKMQLYEPEWSDDMAKAPKGSGKGGPKGREAPLMSKTLSKSEHSLFQAKGGPAGGAKTPLAPLAPSLGKPSRIPRGPYAEVKPLSKAPEAAVSDDAKSDDELLSSKAKAQKGSGPAPPAKGQEERAFLKVDPELVVTVLGDLEQLLFSQVLDPESQRKRTVQNVLDLRQNLEETMSSLRGSQVTHSSLEMTCYDSDDANPRSVSSLSNRSSPLSWRYGQSSPRLQAGDAPSVGGSCRSEGPPAWYMHGERAHYAHTMPMRSPSKLGHISRLELVESLDSEDVDLKSGYMSDSDLMGKTMTEDDDITTGWDESSSISSGLSDASDNLSSEEFNASSSLNSLPTTPTASRRNSTIVLRTDSEKRSLAESGLSWFSESEEKAPRKLEYDSGSLKMEPAASKWRRGRPESCDDASKAGELKKPAGLGPPGSLKKGKTPPVAVTSPITHTAQSALKVAGKPEGKAAAKAKLAVKSAGLQRSSSDAGRDRLGDAKKPPSGIARPSTSGSFGYKKPPPATGTATVVQTGGSATLGKAQKSSGIPVKPANGRKTSLDVSNSTEPGFLAPGARSNIQYRSLPRPAKSSSMSVTGGRGGPRRAGRRTSSVCAHPTHRGLRRHARAAAKSFIKPPSLANLDKVNSNSLDLPASSDAHAPKAADLHTPGPAAGGPLASCFTPSPAPILNINSASFSQGLELMSSFGVPKEPRMYPKLSGLHRSMVPRGHPGPQPLSLGPAPGGPTPPTAPAAEDAEELAWSGSPRAGQLDSNQRDRNTLPKKGLRLTLPERHWEPGTALSELPSPPALSMSLSAKGQLTNIVSPTAATTPRITRSNSIPAHETAFELYSGSQTGSTLSLAERPKGMIRSGSFRDPADDVHGSVLSLASSASSTYSSAEERMQSEQIRKLRRELESSQEKVATLTSQLSANANLVAAFEQSLVSMTCRLRHLAETAEEKDTELLDLRETIDFLKKKNSEAQAVIQGALNASEATPKGAEISRPHKNLNVDVYSSFIHSRQNSEATQLSCMDKCMSKRCGGQTMNYHSALSDLAAR
nr:PREDICTED: neuron navigator 1 [Bos mutus]